MPRLQPGGERARNGREPTRPGPGRSWTRTLLLATGMLALMVALAEGLLRLNPVQAALGCPSLGSTNNSLDLKVFLLQQMAGREGRPDFLFVGSSHTNRSIDPTRFRETYAAVTGRPVRCFNFGVNALTPYPGSRILPVLARLFHPRIILWGISPPDFHTRWKRREAELQENPWVRHQCGLGSFPGWLTAVSATYRYYLRFRIWLDFPQVFDRQRRQERLYNPYGYFRQPLRLLDQRPPPAQAALSEGIIAHFHEDPGVWRRLSAALRLSSGTPVVFFETPLHPHLKSLYPGGSRTHERMLAKLSAFAARNGAFFIPFPAALALSDAEWLDFDHLNDAGAEKFSRWLAEAIGTAVQAGRIGFPGSTP